jgi:ABC-type polysaccharide transport system permease subunit
MENKEKEVSKVNKDDKEEKNSLKENQFKKIEWNKKALITTLVLLGLLIIVFVIVMILLNSGTKSSSESCDGSGTCPIHFISWTLIHLL